MLYTAGRASSGMLQRAKGHYQPSPVKVRSNSAGAGGSGGSGGGGASLGMAWQRMLASSFNAS